MTQHHLGLVMNASKKKLVVTEKDNAQKEDGRTAQQNWFEEFVSATRRKKKNLSSTDTEYIMENDDKLIPSLRTSHFNKRRKKWFPNDFSSTSFVLLDLGQNRTGHFHLLDEVLAISILLYIEPEARLSQCCSTCKSFFSLRNHAAMWPVLVCRSSSKSFNEISAVRLASTLPLGNLQRLELDARKTSSISVATKKKKVCSFRRCWKPLLTAIPCNLPCLHIISLRGAAFKAATLKLIGTRFGRQLKHVEFRNNDAPNILVQLLSRTPCLQTLGLDHLSEAGAIANANALDLASCQNKNFLRRLLVFKRSAYSDVKMERAVSLEFLATRLGELFPHLEEIDLKQVVLPTGLIHDLSEYTSTLSSTTTTQITCNFILDRLLPQSIPVKQLTHLRSLSLSLRLLGVTPNSSSSVVTVVAQILLRTCPVLTDMALDLEATATPSVLGPLLNNIQKEATTTETKISLRNLAVLGLHILDPEADAHSIFNNISSVSWLYSLNNLNLVFSDLPFYKPGHAGDVSHAWIHYFRTVFYRVATSVFCLFENSSDNYQLDPYCQIKVGIADRRNISESRLYHDRTGITALDDILWLKSFPRIRIVHKDKKQDTITHLKYMYNDNLSVI